MMSVAHEERCTIDPSLRAIRLLMGLLLTTAIATGCSKVEQTIAPVRADPTRAPTATSLPPLPTLAGQGSADNPLIFVYILPEDAEPGSEPQPLADTFQEEAGLTLAFEPGERSADAYSALCDGSAAVAVLDAFAYLAADEAGCGQGIYQIAFDGELAVQTQLIAAANRVYTIQNFRDRVFCRPDAFSAAGWVIPALALRANGIDPLTDLGGVVDAGDDEAILDQITSGACDVGATAVGAEGQLEDPDAIDVIEVLPPLPNSVVMVSTQLNGETRAVLGDWLRQHRDDLSELLRADSLEPFNSSVFTDLRLLVEQAGVDVLALSD